MNFIRKEPASYDLHLHTCWSKDAKAEPELYFQQARNFGVRCLAITEHHHMDSLQEILALADQYPEIRVIPSAELTVETSIGAVDLLCYNLPCRPEGLLSEVLVDYREWQKETARARRLAMQALGHDYTEEAQIEVLRRHRPARVLDKQGVQGVFLSYEKSYFLERRFITTSEDYNRLVESFPEELRHPRPPAVEKVVSAVKSVGGLVVIAHPTSYFMKDNRERMDSLRMECELDGIECAHRKIPPALSILYREYCLENNLLSTAGSDCHNPKDILTQPEAWGYTPLRRFACHLGEDTWLEEFLHRLDQ